MALDLLTGHKKWSRKLKSYDTWTVACIAPHAGVTCPSPAGPDYDFGGSGANLLGNLVGFGQKSGIFWALNPENGEILWSTIVGPGSSLGGIEWGTASWQTPDPTKGTIDTGAASVANGAVFAGSYSGSMYALDAGSGKILWSFASGGTVIDGPSIADGVVYWGSGYKRISPGTGNNKLYAFQLGGYESELPKSR